MTRPLDPRAPVAPAPSRGLDAGPARRPGTRMQTVTLALLLALGVAAVSTGALFARLAEAEPLAKAAWRCAVATLVLAVVGGPGAGRALAAAPRSALGATCLAGTCLAVHFATWIASLDFTSVATSLLLVNTNPVWVVLLAPLVNGERASRRALAGVALALSGGVWLAAGASPAADAPAGSLEGALEEGSRWLGPSLAVCGAWAATGYFLLGRRVGGRIPLVPYLGLCYGVATAWLCVAALARGVPLSGFPAMTYLWVVALGLVPQLIGHSACNAALRRLPALLVALPLLLEPIVGSWLAWAVLGEVPPARAWSAGALVLLGVARAAWPARAPQVN
ncbi:MAG: DMT family transporter [Planctomycetota bacterium]